MVNVVHLGFLAAASEDRRTVACFRKYELLEVRVSGLAVSFTFLQGNCRVAGHPIGTGNWPLQIARPMLLGRIKQPAEAGDADRIQSESKGEVL
jgi:hypothetical protein